MKDHSAGSARNPSNPSVLGELRLHSPVILSRVDGEGSQDARTWKGQRERAWLMARTLALGSQPFRILRFFGVYAPQNDGRGKWRAQEPRAPRRFSKVVVQDAGTSESQRE